MLQRPFHFKLKLQTEGFLPNFQLFVMMLQVYKSICTYNSSDCCHPKYLYSLTTAYCNFTTPSVQAVAESVYPLILLVSLQLYNKLYIQQYNYSFF